MGAGDQLEAVIRRVVREELRAQREAAPPAVESGERLLSVAKAAERASTSTTTVYRWIESEGLPTVAVPGRVDGKPMLRIRQADFDAWVASRPGAKAAPRSIDALIAERRAVKKGGGQPKRAAAGGGKGR